jgi:hypothetical protein
MALNSVGNVTVLTVAPASTVIKIGNDSISVDAGFVKTSNPCMTVAIIENL